MPLRANEQDKSSPQANEAAQALPRPLPLAVKLWLAFNAAVLPIHLVVALVMRLPDGYELKTDGQGGGPGDGLYFLFILVVLVAPALGVMAGNLGVLVWSLVSRHRRASKALLLVIVLWSFAIAVELR